ncbi:nucleoside 2-deoxyribosyltransferase [Halopseudomonas sp.]|uniref:nucleoside 2-deoxyribosyltransferase n=1 Tax=Halopseudomonas sp. TaxID=2901191 RepID=UPI0030027123
MQSVYLAGFDVFRRDAVAQGERLKALCAEQGLRGVYPLDDAPAGEVSDLASWICQSNLQKIRDADAVLANLNSFRGSEPDSGTVFEIGYAAALGKPVWAYFSDQRPLIEQLDTDDRGYCAQGYQVEDFALPKNLMLACSWAGASESAQAGIVALAELLR